MKRLRCWCRGAAQLMISHTAAALNLGYTDCLSFAHNLQHDRRSVDLAPGMRLRIEPAGYSFHAPEHRPGAAANAFTTSGTYILHVNRDRSGRVTFDPWTSAIQASQIGKPSAKKTVATEVLGLLDLSGQGMAKRYWRLMWPGQFGGADGDADTPNFRESVALIGGDTYEDLETAANHYVTGGNPEPKLNSCAFLSGRGIIIPEIAVTLNGQNTWVALGTTLRQLLATEVQAAPAQFATAQTEQSQFQPSLSRWAQTTNGTAMERVPVAFADGAAGTFDKDGNTLWDVPLMMGDQVASVRSTGEHA